MTAAVAALLLTSFWFAGAYPRGMLTAEVDWLRGHREVKTFGLRARWEAEYASLLEERYDVHLDRIAGCVVTPWLVSYAEGYNSISRARIIGHFGKDIFKECTKDAMKKEKEAHLDMS